MPPEENPIQDGSGGNSPNPDGVGGDKGGAVSHETYKRTMDELKTVKSQLREFQKEKETRDHNDRLAKDQHLQIIEEQKARLAELEAENGGLKQSFVDHGKLSAALNLLHDKGIKLDSQYYGMIDLKKIVLGEDGRPDKTSVAKVVSDFEKQHPRLVAPAGKILPTDRPGGTVQQMTIAEWKKLPPKEQKQALADGKVEKWKRQ